MIPGEVIPGEGAVVINEGRPVTVLRVVNTGDRPVQVGSHYHFAEANPALDFDREAAWGRRLDVPAGMARRYPRAAARSMVSAGLASAKW